MGSVGWFVIALTASLGADLATAGLLDMNEVPAWLRILVAGRPAVAFLGGTFIARSAPPTAPDTDTDLDVDAIEGREDPPELAPSAWEATAFGRAP